MAKTWQAFETEALTHLASGDLSQAASVLIDGIEAFPSAVGLYRHLIQITMLGGSTETAVKAARELKSLEPDNPENGYLLGLALLAHGDFIAAESALDTAVKQAPKSWQLRQAQAQVARALKKNGRASQALEEAVALAPTEPQVVLDYATLLVELNEALKAKEVVARALKTHTTDAKLHLLQAQVLAKLQESYEATHHATRALESEDPDVRAVATGLLAMLKQR